MSNQLTEKQKEKIDIIKDHIDSFYLTDNLNDLDGAYYTLKDLLVNELRRMPK